ALSGQGLAAETDIAHAPIALSSTEVVKPNVMFILDDSTSMDRAYSPDTANFASNRIGAFSSHCNGMYFNPDVEYQPPVKADGESYYPDANFASAKSNGYATSGSGTNLANSVYYLYSKTGTRQPDLDFEYET